VHISPVHLYIHVPFCARRCSYCDFAIAVRRAVPSAAFAAAVRSEWDRWQSHPAWRESPGVDTIYFGGGTPSRLDPAAIAAILAAIGRARVVAPGAELTLEANPDDVTPAAAAAWAAAGINRVSLGVQSFDPEVLAWMHRTHTAAQVPSAVAALRSAGIADISLDLIFALPRSLRRDWGADLDRALALQPDHLSLYGLTVEPRTPLGRWAARAEVAPADDEAYAAEFLLAHERMVGAGLEHYEVSNAGRPGRRARHNSAYWRRAPFIGLGPAAHSGFGAVRQWNLRDWPAWQRAVESGSATVAGGEELDAAQLRLEERYLGLRTIDGLNPAGIPEDIRKAWETAGWARTTDRTRLTPEGWLRLDALVAALP
jgi:oxygen-independent coproporphyrinogen-3 oxidase